MNPAHLRPQAEADLIEAGRHFAKEGSLERAARAALEPIERMPAMDSPRPGERQDIVALLAADS